jgi:hypothetical protein
MTSLWRKLLLITFVAVSTQLVPAQESKKVTITEPTIIPVPTLFKQSDTMALAKVVSGEWNMSCFSKTRRSRSPQEQARPHAMGR